MGFNYLFIFSPSYVALCGSKACHRLGSECFLVFGIFSLFKTLFPGGISVPTSFVSLFIFYIFSYLLSKTMGCFSGCLMSSASIQTLFCGIYSAFKCSFDEFVGEKVVSLSYSSAIFCVSPDAKSRARCSGPAVQKEQTFFVRPVFQKFLKSLKKFHKRNLYESSDLVN